MHTVMSIMSNTHVVREAPHEELSRTRQELYERNKLLIEFLDLCPRMNEGDPIGPALADLCKRTKKVFQNH